MTFTYVSDEEATGRMEAAVHSAGGNAHGVRADLTDLGSVEQLAASIPNTQLQHLNVVVNNAAIASQVTMIEDTTRDIWNDDSAAHTSAAFLMVAAPHRF